MNYYPPEKLCVNCFKQNKYFPVSVYIYMKMKIYSMYCLPCFIQDVFNSKNKDKFTILTNSKQRWTFDLNLEKRYYLQEKYSEIFETVFKTEVVDQERLEFVEDLEEKMGIHLKEMRKIDKELITILHKELI